ncbi:MAG: hypothetical protein Q8M76_05225 [Spirochaetaceae bacterium]|nr:hypothetical protein [Spirochaetaceae bacterium]
MRARLESIVEDQTGRLQQANGELKKRIALYEVTELLMKEIHNKLHSKRISDPEARAVYGNLQNCIKSASHTKIELG